jgi:hypothetical protein
MLIISADICMKDLVTECFTSRSISVIIGRTKLNIRVSKLNEDGRKILNNEEHGDLYTLLTVIRMSNSRRKRNRRFRDM